MTIKTWEYKVKTCDEMVPIENWLNELGSQGWEMVTISLLNGAMPYVYFFKRPVFTSEED
jgi:hypothetical protein